MPQTDRPPSRSVRRSSAAWAVGGVLSCLLLAAGFTAGWLHGGGWGDQEGDLSGEPASLQLGLGDKEIRLDGEITDGTAKRLLRMLRAHPGVKLVSLTSGGGLVDEAEQVGSIVAALGLSTYVPDDCVSACTLVFVRGQERLVSTGGRVGFHAPWVADTSGREVQVGTEEATQSYLSAGIAPDFTAQAMKVPPTEIWYPDPPRLIEARVVTAYVDPGELPARVERLPTPQRRWAARADRK